MATVAKKKPLCDEARLSVLVCAWQRAPQNLQTEWWALIVEETADWIMAIVRSFRSDLTSLGTHEEIRAELFLHLHNRVLPAFTRGRGRLFSLVTLSCYNYIRTLLDRHARYRRHYVAAAELSDRLATAFEPETDLLGAVVQPEVYSLPAEIRERLDRFTAPGTDFEFFLVCNLVVYCFTEGRWGGTPPPLEQIAKIVGKIVSLDGEQALAQTRAAVTLLCKELAEFRGRAPLPRAESDQEYVCEYSSNDSLNNSAQTTHINLFDYSSQ